MSQNKVSSHPDLIHYFELKKLPPKTDLVAQPKCDGLSLEIVYQKGKFTEAITRGDGKVGDVISQNVVKMQHFVPRLPQDLSCSVRCEIVVTKPDFKKLNQAAKRDNEGDFYSNPRNAASGLSQRLDSKYSNLCTLMAVDIFPNLTSIMDEVKLLRQLGFTPVETHLCHDFDQVEAIYQDFLTSQRQKYPYDIDGLVIKINDNQLAQKLGQKNNRPKYQVAYKFPADTNQTTIKSIAWQVGPMGSITPVANVQAIELAGAIITFASLGNHDLLVQKDINVGDIVKISRRGDVIPHIEKVITKVTPGHIPVPLKCPSCHSSLVTDHKYLRCPNTSLCPDQVIGSLNLFCQTLDILGLSDKTIRKLYLARLVKLPGDFYRLTPDNISNLENLGDKSAANIIAQIQSKKSLTLRQAFDAAIIPNFSTARIQQLIDAGFDTPDKLLRLTVADLLTIKGFQTTLAQKIVTGLKLRRPWIRSILDQVTILPPSPVTHHLPLKGLSFCLTGELSQPRPEVIKIIEDHGGKVQSAVSKNTSYLLTNDTNSASSKFQTAQKLGIKIINEEQFSTLIA